MIEPQMATVTVTSQDQRVDLVLSATLPIAELLPGMVAKLGQLNATSATFGFDVNLSSGTPLKLSSSLADQHVASGAVLTLVPRESNPIPRYDDIAEAVGTVVEATRVPWGRHESLQLSVWCATALCVAAAAVLALRGQGGQAITAGCVAAVLVGVCSAAVARLNEHYLAVAMVAGACALLGATGWIIAPAGQVLWQIVAAAIGVAIATSFLLAQPRAIWPISFGFLTISVGLLVFALMVLAVNASWAAAAGTTVALTMIAQVLLPSGGLMLVPARRLALAFHSSEQVPFKQVDQEVRQATLAVTAVRVGMGVLLVLSAPLLLANWWGVALLICCAISLALSTRDLFAREEVYSNALAALTSVLLAGLVAAWQRPTASLWLGGALVAGAIVLVLHSLTAARYRPGFDRVLDAVWMITTIAVIPLAALMWGIF
ncbi:MAG: EsaB/YukD family protein [Propionibacteriaceae bacterium]|nr:EsaB/YukD family protein [Propionibacteriaceae bacterium]